MVWRKINFIFPWRIHRWFILCGFFMFSINYALTYYATHYLSSGLVSVLFSTMVIFSALNAIFFMKEKPTRNLWVGIFLGLSGIGLLFWHKFSVADLTTGAVIGFAACILASYFSSLGNVLVSWLQKQDLPAIPITFWGMVYGVLIQCLIIFCLGETLMWDERPTYLLSLIYLAVFGSVVAFLSLFDVLKNLGPTRAGYISLLMPVVALVISTFFEDFIWAPEKFLGVTCVLGGKVVMLLQKKAT